MTNSGIGENEKPNGISIYGGGSGAGSIEPGFRAIDEPEMGEVVSVDGSIDDKIQFTESLSGGPGIVVDGKQINIHIGER